MPGLLLGPSARASLAARGYTAIRAPRAARHCAAAVARWSTVGAFRFPAVDGSAAPDGIMESLYRRAFDELYALAATASSELLNTTPPATNARPFGEGSSGTRPFAHGAARSPLPFSSSFCSVFNFDHGFLNSHLDRGLLTAIWGRCDDADGEQPAVRLWGRLAGHSGGSGGGGGWELLDAAEPADAAEPPAGCHGAADATDTVLLLVGEALERRSGGAFPAVLHACRIDPAAERLSMLHRGPHPSAPATGNRQSIALVLAQE